MDPHSPRSPVELAEDQQEINIKRKKDYDCCIIGRTLDDSEDCEVKGLYLFK